jgi:hypothetical protein
MIRREQVRARVLEMIAAADEKLAEKRKRPARSQKAIRLGRNYPKRPVEIDDSQDQRLAWRAAGGVT